MKPSMSTLPVLPHCRAFAGARVERILLQCKLEGRYWLAKCDCGKVFRLRTDHFGKVRSCGCYKADNPSHVTHGGSQTQEYRVWAGMGKRCSNPNDSVYDKYGGLGVVVCERWSRFENFLEDMGHRPSTKHSIDRIDSFGNYEPSNCRWATPEEQANNRRVIPKYEYCGELRTVAQIARLACVSSTRLHHHIKRMPLLQAIDRCRQ